MNFGLGFEAFGWGALSAISLPLGATLGLALRPGKKVTSALMAFGGGALLFALTLELFGEAMHQVHDHGKMSIIVMVLGAIFGGLVFEFFNQLLNNKGAFIRKLSTTKKYVTRIKFMTAKAIVKELGKVEVLQKLPPREIARLVPHMQKKTFAAGETIFKQGDPGDALYFIASGEVRVQQDQADGKAKEIAVLDDHDVIGEMALLTDLPRSATVIAIKETEAWAMYRSNFDDIIQDSAELKEALATVVQTRMDHLGKVHNIDPRKSEQWQKAATKRLGQLSIHVSSEEIKQEVGKVDTGKGNAAMAVWLGLLIDGIPESLVIGMLAASASGMSFAFIAGVFLANLPEALSSSVGMRNSGMKIFKIMWMWGSICLVTAIGAFIGAMILPSELSGGMLYFVHGVEGMAAGAMLTMIAETMLPEAYEHGGSVVGISTLLGFLAALMVKLI